MKLATLKDGSRDGRLAIVSRDLAKAVYPAEPRTMQSALERWDDVAPALIALYDRLNAGDATDAFDFDPHDAMAPLPRAYQWLDGSTYANHGQWMERAFNLTPIDTTLPLMYQGGSDDFLGPHDDVPLPDDTHGIDCEAEVVVIVDDVPLGATAAEAATHIRLVMLANDWSLRGLQPRELKTGFGFIHAKPSTSFGPVAVTLDELGEHWKDDRLHLPLAVDINERRIGQPNAGEMSVGFGRLLEHAACTRRLRAGSLVGSGTVSDAADGAGSAALAEVRAIEQVTQGKITTPFLTFGDRVRMDMQRGGASIFGVIDQQVVRAGRDG
jgi:fumarylacetoacetate (FAA) hydrolase